MKKLLILVLALSLVFTFASCKEEVEAPDNTEVVENTEKTENTEIVTPTEKVEDVTEDVPTEEAPEEALEPDTPAVEVIPTEKTDTTLTEDTPTEKAETSEPEVEVVPEEKVEEKPEILFDDDGKWSEWYE